MSRLTKPVLCSTPLHAAASWAHPDILRYLVQKGGNINTTDEDGETSLYVVETTEMAALVIELGGDPRWKNAEGVTVSLPVRHSHRMRPSSHSTNLANTRLWYPMLPIQY